MKSLLTLLLLVLSVGLAQAQLDRISVAGNRFVNEAGQEVIFRGYSCADPDNLKRRGYWNKSYFEEMKRWGSNLVRLPIHPTAWKRRGEEAYLKLLDEGIKWAADLGMYVILDWHSIGNLHTEKFQAPMYNTTKKETYEFWKVMGEKYGKNTTVAFYELFNEPTTFNNQLGTLTWKEWKPMNEEMIDIIRANGGEGIPLVAGFNWAYNLMPVKQDPIDAEGIGYVAHPYPQKRNKPWEPKWTFDWGFVKDKYPLILTEIGFSGEDDPGAHIPVISDESYGDAITAYSDDRHISYVVWCFDKSWAPRLFEDDQFTPSRQGRYFKKKLTSYK